MARGGVRIQSQAMCDAHRDSYHPITIIADWRKCGRGYVPSQTGPWMYNFLVKLLQRDHQVQLDGDGSMEEDSSRCLKYIRRHVPL
jgi:hypothetical protein